VSFLQRRLHIGCQGGRCPCSNFDPLVGARGPINRRAHSFAATDGEDGPSFRSGHPIGPLVCKSRSLFVCAERTKGLQTIVCRRRSTCAIYCSRCKVKMCTQLLLSTVTTIKTVGLQETLITWTFFRNLSPVAVALHRELIQQWICKHPVYLIVVSAMHAAAASSGYHALRDCIYSYWENNRHLVRQLRPWRLHRKQ